MPRRSLRLARRVPGNPSSCCSKSLISTVPECCSRPPHAVRANQDFHSLGKPNIHARTETYHTYSLSPSHGIPNRLPADNSPRNPAGDLLENHFPALGLDMKYILLIFGRCAAAHGRIKFSRAVFNGSDAPRHGRAVHVHVENGKKNADPAARLARPAIPRPLPLRGHRPEKRWCPDPVEGSSADREKRTTQKDPKK